MRKLFLVIGFCFLFLFTGLNVNAEVVNYDEVNAIVDSANAEIYAKIDQAQIEADQLLANESNQNEVNKELDRIIFELLTETNNISKETINELSQDYGVYAECEYIQVTIGDRLVDVDPIRVYTW